MPTLSREEAKGGFGASRTSQDRPKKVWCDVICDSCRHDTPNPIRVDNLVLCSDCQADLSLFEAPSGEANKVAEWLTTAFENNLMPVVVYDPITMQFLDANDEALELCGYARAAIVGLGLPDVVVSMDDMEPLLRRRFAPVMKAGPFEIRVPRGRFAINTLGVFTTYRQQRCRIVALYPLDVEMHTSKELSISHAG